MKRKLFFLTIASMFIVNVMAQTPRLVLLEHGSSATCGPCAAQNPTLTNTLNANKDKIIAIKYQVWWPAPGNDPMYLANPSEIKARVQTYYAINSVPQSVLDGNVFQGAPTGITTTSITNRQKVNSPFEIKLTHNTYSNGDSVHVRAVIKASEVVSLPSLVLQIALIENHIQYDKPASTNGETEFKNVMRKMLPNASGTDLQDAFQIGDSVVIEKYAKIVNYKEKIELAVVAFVQNNATKEVLQAAYSAPKASATTDASLKSILEPSTEICGDIVLPKIRIKNEGSNNLTSLKVQYNVNSGNLSEFNWTGNVAFLENAEISLPSYTFIVKDTNTLKVIISNPSDANGKNDTLTKTFFKSKKSISKIYLEIKTDQYGSETSWSLKNSAGTVIKSGGPYTDAATVRKDSFDINTVDCYSFELKDTYGDGIGSGGYCKLTDFRGNILKNIVGNNNGSFGKLDVTPFNLPSASPLSKININGQTNVAVKPQIVIVFSEPMRFINNDAITDANISQFIKLQPKVSKTDIAFTATINAAKTAITLTPNSDLNYLTDYKLNILSLIEDDDNVVFDADSAVFKTVNGTGIANISENTIELFPNPVNEKLFINIDKLENVSINIIDNMGKIVKELKNVNINKQYQIETSDLNSGNYIINIINNDVNLNKKFIINK